MDKFNDEKINNEIVSQYSNHIKNNNRDNLEFSNRGHKFLQNIYNNSHQSTNKDENKILKNKKEKKIYYKGTMNNTRGIPPLPNWSNRFSSIIIENNLLYISNNYIVNIDMQKKEFIQLIHSSLNIYFENKYSVICKIKDLSIQNYNNDEEAYIFIAIDSNGIICFFNKVKEINNNPFKNSGLSKESDIEKTSYEYLYFREERYSSKLCRSVVIKTILNLNLVNYYDVTICFDNEKNREERDLNLILFGDNNGYLNVLIYYYNEKEKEIQTDKSVFNSVKLSKGICTDINIISEKSLILVSTSSGTIEFYSILNEQKNNKNIRCNNGNDLLILTHIFESNLSFIFSVDYFLSLNLEQINISIIDKNGSFALQSLNFKDILINKDVNTENNFLINSKYTTKNELKQHLLQYNLSFKILDKNRFNNKSIKDEYLFFSHKIVIKSNNEKQFEIFFTSNKGKLYYTTLILENFSLIDDHNSDLKLKYSEIPENPHTKNIFSISKISGNKLLFIGADGVISLFDHIYKFFEMNVKTIRFRPSAFVQNFNKNNNLFFYDEGNNLLKYNHNKLNNGLQMIERKPLKIKNSEERNFSFFKKNEINNFKEIKDCIKIKNCIQANFNENIFAMLEYNFILKSYSISVYDFGSDTRIYRRDLLFKIKTMQFATERKFEDLQDIIDNRDDLKKSQNKQITKIDDFLDNFNLREHSGSNEEDVIMDYEIEKNNDIDSDLNYSESKDENPELKELIENEEEENNIKDEKFFIKNNFNLGLNENDNIYPEHEIQFEKTTRDKGKEKNNISMSKIHSNKIKNKKLFDNYDEKKYMYGEKFKKIIQQIFNENNIYELLHLIDEDNNYIVIDFLKNKCNSHKLMNFDYSKNKKKNKVFQDQINSNIKIVNLNEDQKSEKPQEKYPKFKNKYKLSLMIHIVNSNRDFNKEYSDDIILVKLEGNSIKIGIINQIQDFYLANINFIDNSITYNNTLFDQQNLKLQEDAKNFIKSSLNIQNENDLKNISIELVNNFNSKLQGLKFKENYNNIMLITLEREKNIRIIRIGSTILELLNRYNIWENFEHYNQRNSEIANLIKESTEPHSNGNKSDNKKNLLSQVFYKNLSNVSAIDLKAFYIYNNKPRINIIASLIDNSIKFFELAFSINDLSNLEKTSLTLKYSINAHIARIQDIVFISETNIASLSYDQSLKIWDTDKCKLIDLPIKNHEHLDKNFAKSNDEKESQKIKSDKSNDLLFEKKNLIKIFPIFTKIVNDAIYSQSYASCKEFINNFTNFYEKLKHKKNELLNNKESNYINMLDFSQTIQYLYFELIPFMNESKNNCIFDKKYLDYLIFTFSENDWINKQTAYFMIKYEIIKNHNDNAKINNKNMQTLFCLAFYLFIFNFNKNLEEIYQIFFKIKIKIQGAHSEHELKLNGENNVITQNESNPKFYSNLLNKIEVILTYFDNELKIQQENNFNNLEENRVKNLLDLIQIVFNDLPLREKFFYLLINKKYDEVEIILDENELYFENLILTKLISFDESDNYLDCKKSFLKFKENLNKFRAYIYPKQIYQAQKCQSVLNVLNDFNNEN